MRHQEQQHDDCCKAERQVAIKNLQLADERYRTMEKKYQLLLDQSLAHANELVRKVEKLKQENQDLIKENIELKTKKVFIHN